MIEQFLTKGLVAHQVAGTIEYYSYIPALGFSAAASTLVGISLGEKNEKKAKEITWKTWLLANVIRFQSVLFSFLLLLCLRQSLQKLQMSRHK